MRKSFESMTEQEALQHIRELRLKLLAKQQREKAYLARRASRGIHTPTDDAYESDQELEDDLLALLSNVEKGLIGSEANA